MASPNADGGGPAGGARRQVASSTPRAEVSAPSAAVAAGRPAPDAAAAAAAAQAPPAADHSRRKTTVFNTQTLAGKAGDEAAAEPAEALSHGERDGGADGGAAGHGVAGGSAQQQGSSADGADSPSELGGSGGVTPKRRQSLESTISRIPSESTMSRMPSARSSILDMTVDVAREVHKIFRSSEGAGGGQSDELDGEDTNPFFARMSGTDEVSLEEQLFGKENRNANLQGDAEDEDKRNWVWLEPEAGFRRRWDALIIMLIVYGCIVLPLRLTWGNGTMGPLFAVDLVIDCLFLTDIWLNFNTGFDDGGILEMRRGAVRRHYLRSWFAFDLLASLPLDLVSLTEGTCELEDLACRQRQALVRLPRLIRLLRVPRLFRYVRKFEGKLPINSTGMRMVKLVYCIVLFAHVNACVQYLIEDMEGFPDDGWVNQSDGLQFKGTTSQYTHAIFRALSHMLCIGYGLKPPRNNVELWVVIISMVLGASFYVLVVGMTSSLMLGMDRSGALYAEKMDVLKQYFDYRALPKDLRGRCMDFYQSQWTTRKFFDERNMLKSLGACLHTDIAMYACRDIIKNVPLFKMIAPETVCSMVPELTQLTFMPNELVYKEGEIGTAMYFIQSGELSVESAKGVVFTTLGVGSYFGEFSILFGDCKTRTASVRALTLSVLWRLNAEDFWRLQQVYPEISMVIQSIAEVRVQRSKKLASSDSQMNKLATATEEQKSRAGAAAAGQGGSDGGAMQQEDKLLSRLQNQLGESSQGNPQQPRSPVLSRSKSTAGQLLASSVQDSR